MRTRTSLILCGLAVLALAAGQAAADIIVTTGTTTDPGGSGTIYFGSANGSATNGQLTLTASNTVWSYTALTVRTNSTTANVLDIASGKTLTLSGTMAVGYDANNTSASYVAYLTVQGGGALTASTLNIAYSSPSAAANTDNGTMTINSGTLTASNVNVGRNSQKGTVNGTLNIGGTTTANLTNVVLGLMTGGNTGTGKTTNGTLAISGTSTVNITGDLTLGRNNQTAGGGTGNGTLNITGGTVTMLTGNIVRGASGTIPGGSSTLTLNGGTLDMANHNIGSTTAITFNAQSGTLKNIASINGTGGLTKTTAGTLTLAGANTYTGATTISLGTLKLGMANVIPDGSGKGNVSVAGTLDLNTYSDTINGLSGAGTVDTVAGGTPTLTVGNNNATGAANTFSGVIKNTAGALALTKIGTGILTLSNANTYSGATTITDGTLALGAGGSINNSPTIDVASSAVFDVSAVTGGYTLGASQTLMGTGTVAGAIIVAGILSPGNSPGTITVNNGTETWAGGGKYDWQLWDAGTDDTPGTPGINWDFTDVTGTGNLAVTAAVDNKFNIVLQTLSSIGPDVQGAPLNWDASLRNQSWKIASSANAITGWDVADGEASGLFAIDPTNFVGAGPGSSFNVSKTGNDVYLNYIPEPATIALLGFGALAMVLRRRSRKA